jgi:hypothetical protein
VGRLEAVAVNNGGSSLRQVQMQLLRGEGAVQEGEREGREGREKEPSSRQTRFYFMGRESRRKVERGE